MQNVVRSLLSTDIKEPSVALETAQLNFVGIKAVREVSEEPVFNMTVEQHHNYITNDGVVVKNCDTDRYIIYTDSLNELSGVYKLR